MEKALRSFHVYSIPVSTLMKPGVTRRSIVSRGAFATWIFYVEKVRLADIEEEEKNRKSVANGLWKAYAFANMLTKIFVSGNMMHTCEWCGRPFSWPSSLRLHQRMACGKPPNFCCTICDYKSNFKGNLKRHLLCKHRIHMH